MSLQLLDYSTPQVTIQANPSTDPRIQVQEWQEKIAQHIQQQATTPSQYLAIVHGLRRTLEILQAQRVHTCVVVVERKCTSCLLLQEVQRLLDEVGILLTGLSIQNSPSKRSGEQLLVVLNTLVSVLGDLVHDPIVLLWVPARGERMENFSAPDL